MEGTGTEVVLKVKPFRTVRDVKLSIARRFKVTMAELESPCRKRRFAHPRQIAMAIAYKRLKRRGYSAPMIGREFGGRDHTTVLYACRKFGMPVDPFVSARSASAAQRRNANPSRQPRLVAVLDLEAWRSMGGSMEDAA